jgi:hypothetical protein
MHVNLSVPVSLWEKEGVTLGSLFSEKVTLLRRESEPASPLLQVLDIQHLPTPLQYGEDIEQITLIGMRQGSSFAKSPIFDRQ